MGKAGTKRTCVFCGSTPLTNEHIWPRWLRQLSGPRAQMEKAFERNQPHVILSAQLVEGIAVIQPILRGKRIPVMDLTVRVTCGRCNGGWMSQLETRTKPILSAMMTGSTQVLGAEDVLTMATWAFKTTAMFQHNHPPTMAVTRAALIDLKRNGMPPAGARVYAFWASSTANSMRLCNNGLIAVTPEWRAPVPSSVNLSSTMLCADRVGFLVTFSQLDLTTFDPRFPGLMPFWPGAGPLTWPPVAASDELVESISQWRPGFSPG